MAETTASGTTVDRSNDPIYQKRMAALVKAREAKERNKAIRAAQAFLKETQDPEPEPAPAPAAKVKTTPVSTEPAILPNLRRVQGSKLSYGHRSITMLRPSCAICQEGQNVAYGWQKNCPHDPYMGVTTQTWDEPVYVNELGTDGNPTGVTIVKEIVKKSRSVPRPNWAEISVTTRVNGGVGVAIARRKGFIRPSELRNEAFPNGIAECCEWSDCKWQQNLVEYPDGRFCREIEARYASIDIRGPGGGKHNFEIGHDPQSLEIRQTQLQNAVIR